MKLAEVSNRLVREGEGDPRLGHLKMEQERVDANEREITQLNQRIQALQLSVETCKMTGECEDESIQRDIKNYEAAIESRKVDVEKYRAMGRDDVVQTNQRHIIQLEEDINRCRERYMVACVEDV